MPVPAGSLAGAPDQKYPLLTPLEKQCVGARESVSAQQPGEQHLYYPIVTIQKGGVKGSFPAIVVALATISRSSEEKLACFTSSA